MIIDTHAHITKEYYENVDEEISKDKNIVLINSGTNHPDCKEIIDLSKKHTNCYGTIGIHPSEVDNWQEETVTFLENNINKKKIVAIGEIGLDYHYGEDREKQKEIFVKQLEIAKKYSKAVVIHSREALEDTYNILKKYPELKKIMHCYSYDEKEVNKFLEINCLIGINGIVTFKNNSNIKKTIEKIGIKNIVLETDSPYLSPEPYRGKTNSISNIYIIAAKIAEILNLNIDQVIRETTQNAIQQFDLDLQK